MNGIEQKKHTTALSTLERATAEAIEGLVQALSLERDMRAQSDLQLQHDIAAERTQRFDMADDQRVYVDAAVQRVQSLLNAEIFDRQEFVGRGFWSRLNWLITGR